MKIKISPFLKCPFWYFEIKTIFFFQALLNKNKNQTDGRDFVNRIYSEVCCCSIFFQTLQPSEILNLKLDEQ